MGAVRRLGNRAAAGETRTSFPRAEDRLGPPPGKFAPGAGAAGRDAPPGLGAAPWLLLVLAAAALRAPPALGLRAAPNSTSCPTEESWWSGLVIIIAVCCASLVFLTVLVIICYKAIKRKPLRKDENGTSVAEYPMSASQSNKGVDVNNAVVNVPRVLERGQLLLGVLSMGKCTSRCRLIHQQAIKVGFLLRLLYRKQDRQHRGCPYATYEEESTMTFLFSIKI
ncbi:proline-rich membrane anchor 1 isoform X2 [Symphalangus syndactylus]|uniref:proline-rich membrane anchor 1 isoform X2 n=1 Tax=Symphalangus syndactylus TaxID=9590 RepID=UPI003004F21B